MRVRLIKEELDAKEPNERRKRITRRRERLRQADGTDRRTDGRTDGRCWTVWDEMKVELNKHEASEAIRDRAERRGVGRRDGSNGKGLNAELREANGEDYCYYAFINAPQEFFSLVHDRDKVWKRNEDVMCKTEATEGNTAMSIYMYHIYENST